MFYDFGGSKFGGKQTKEKQSSNSHKRQKKRTVMIKNSGG
jgi:hypothetical protein